MDEEPLIQKGTPWHQTHLAPRLIKKKKQSSPQVRAHKWTVHLEKGFQKAVTLMQAIIKGNP